MDESDAYEIAGERIREWIEDRFTIENGLKRLPIEDEDDFDAVMWVFTPRGQRLYDSFTSKVNRLLSEKYPNICDNVENYTGVIEC